MRIELLTGSELELDKSVVTGDRLRSDEVVEVKKVVVVSVELPGEEIKLEDKSLVAVLEISPLDVVVDKEDS